MARRDGCNRVRGTVRQPADGYGNRVGHGPYIDRLWMVPVTSSPSADKTGRAVTTNANRASEGLSEAARIREALRSDILVGDLAPGTVLHQEALAARYQSGRTPVRQALIALEGDGLISLPTGRTAIVAEVSARGLLEILEMRMLLEPHVAGKAAAAMPAGVLNDLQRRVSKALRETITPRAVNSLDQAVHAALVDWCGNERMARTVRDLNALLALARVRDLASRHIDVLESLARLLDAIAARDSARAEAEMRDHVKSFSLALGG
jgi:DNA-binding GntR family transcriptional regulator